eukprot:TRINITY_DN4324_c0_g1_i10.p1 TRINITY_DN4324_c0_g1~~TRINITY_DN4324_c0_g1_i10.p1  ORF type:complete len:450 (+),score=102.04 TRINITY_DN4324_c0_g1_i10:1444-2793(+)
MLQHAAPQLRALVVAARRDGCEDARSSLWAAEEVLRRYEVRVLLPQHSRMLQHYSRAKCRTLLLHLPLSQNFFQLLGNSPLGLEITDKHKRCRKRGDDDHEEDNTDGDGYEGEWQPNLEHESAGPGPYPLAEQQGSANGNVQISFSAPYLTPLMSNPTVMTVAVTPHWRMNEGIQRDDIFNAFCVAKCYRPSSQEEVTCARCCSCQSSGIIKVTPRSCAVSANESSPREVFTFSVNSLCSSSRLHMNCSHVVLGFQLKNFLVFNSTPIRLLARARPSDRSAPQPRALVQRSLDQQKLATPPPCTSPSTLPVFAATTRDTFLMIAPQLRTLGPTTPVCVVVRIIRNSVQVTTKQWHTTVGHCFAQMQQHMAAPLSCKAVALSGDLVHSVLNAAYRKGNEGDDPDKWWYSLQVACFAVPAGRRELTQWASHQMQLTFSADLTQVLATICNW